MDSPSSAPNLFTAIALVISCCGATHAILWARRQRGSEQMKHAEREAGLVLAEIPLEGEETNRGAAEAAEQSRKTWTRRWELAHEIPVWYFLAVGFLLTGYVVYETYGVPSATPTCDWTYLRWPLILAVLIGVGSLYLATRSLCEVAAAMKDLNRCQSTSKDARILREKSNMVDPSAQAMSTPITQTPPPVAPASGKSP